MWAAAVFNLPVSTTVPVALQAGTNTIRFGNPTSLFAGSRSHHDQRDGSAVLPLRPPTRRKTHPGSAAKPVILQRSATGASKAGNSETQRNRDLQQHYRTGRWNVSAGNRLSDERAALFLMSINAAVAAELPLNGRHSITPPPWSLLAACRREHDRVQQLVAVRPRP